MGYAEGSRVAYAKDSASIYIPCLLKSPREFYMLLNKSKPDAGPVEWLRGKGPAAEPTEVFDPQNPHGGRKLLHVVL